MSKNFTTFDISNVKISNHSRDGILSVGIDHDRLHSTKGSMTGPNFYDAVSLELKKALGDNELIEINGNNSIQGPFNGFSEQILNSIICNEKLQETFSMSQYDKLPGIELNPSGIFIEYFDTEVPI